MGPRHDRPVSLRLMCLVVTYRAGPAARPGFRARGRGRGSARSARGSVLSRAISGREEFPVGDASAGRTPRTAGSSASARDIPFADPSVAFRQRWSGRDVGAGAAESARPRSPDGLAEPDRPRNPADRNTAVGTVPMGNLEDEPFLITQRSAVGGANGPPVKGSTGFGLWDDGEMVPPADAPLRCDGERWPHPVRVTA